MLSVTRMKACRVWSLGTAVGNLPCTTFFVPQWCTYCLSVQKHEKFFAIIHIVTYFSYQVTPTLRAAIFLKYFPGYNVWTPLKKWKFVKSFSLENPGVKSFDGMWTAFLEKIASDKLAKLRGREGNVRSVHLESPGTGASTSCPTKAQIRLFSSWGLSVCQTYFSSGTIQLWKWCEM